MSPFYNRLAIMPVKTYVDGFGDAEPLDVVPYGGMQKIAPSLAAAANTVILAAPSGAYRLHSWTWRPNSTAPTTGDIFLWDGTTVFADNGFAFGTQAPGGFLGGLVVAGALRAFNNLNAAVTLSLCYDVITNPLIS